MHSGENIVLVGFMGTGKTTVGQRIATVQGMGFLDMDDEIERRRGKPITRIFAEEGEPHFRQLERNLVIELAARRGLVVGTGGGIVLDPRNLDEFSRTGLTICLTARPQTILDRVASQTHRPLLAGDDKLARIRELLSLRQPLYDAVPNQMATDGLSAEDVVQRILQLYRMTERRVVQANPERSACMRTPQSKILDIEDARKVRERLRTS